MGIPIQIMVSDRMPQEKKSKKTELEKLHMILDNPSDPQLSQLCPHDDPLLESIRQRLLGKTIVPHPRATKTIVTSHLQPHAFIRPLHQPLHQPQPSSFPIQRPPSDEPSYPVYQHIVQPQDLYEIEKVDRISEDFAEVIPKEKTKKIEKPYPSSYQPDDASRQKVGSREQEKVLPEWEPVQTIQSVTTTPVQEPTLDTHESKLIDEQSELSRGTQKVELEFAQVMQPEPEITQQAAYLQEKEQRRKQKSKEKEEKKLAKQQEKLAKKQEKQKRKEQKKREKEQQEKEQQKRKELPETQLTLEQTSSVKKFTQELFKDITCIDEKTAELLYRHGFFSVENLRDAEIQDLLNIPGIDKKTAQAIKDEIDMHTSSGRDTHASAPSEKSSRKSKMKSASTEFTEWESYAPAPDTQEQDIEKSDEAIYRYNDYTLYKKELATTDGKKTTIHFFSKEKPDDGIPTDLPEGYIVDINKKTGLPYLKKQKP